jgi:hypothetical protein
MAGLMAGHGWRKVGEKISKGGLKTNFRKFSPNIIELPHVY